MLILYSSQFIRESKLLSDITASKKLRKSDLYQYIDERASFKAVIALAVIFFTNNTPIQQVQKVYSE